MEENTKIALETLNNTRQAWARVTSRYIKKIEADKNKLINYIAIRENKTHEEVEKEFDI